MLENLAVGLHKFHSINKMNVEMLVMVDSFCQKLTLSSRCINVVHITAGKRTLRKTLKKM
jgi:hypothetical protein